MPIFYRADKENGSKPFFFVFENRRRFRGASSGFRLASRNCFKKKSKVRAIERIGEMLASFSGKFVFGAHFDQES
jgi:hypothetical protein